MFEQVKEKVEKGKIQLKPFPYLFLKNLINIKELRKLNKILPSYDDLNGKEILYQSDSKSKKTILPTSSTFKKLSKKKSFKSINLLFKNLQPIILKKFEKQIKLHVRKRFHNTNFKYHSSFSIMRDGYKKSAHLDRRDHLIHMIFYPYSNVSKGGDICLNELKKRKKVFDIFPNKKSLKVCKKYKVFNNSCMMILNVPWAYHSITNYSGKKDRKYFYMVYDFPISRPGSKLKNRKEGFNQNEFWNFKVKVKSIKRKRTFLTE